MAFDRNRPSVTRKLGTHGSGPPLGIWRVVLALPALILTAALGGCGWMSVSGPAASDILAGQRDPVSLNYAITKVTPKVIEIQAKNLPRLIGFKENRRPRDITFGIGDVLGVTIFEAASGGLFIPTEGGVRPGNFVTIPNQAVDIRGDISIPYAGSIRALGSTRWRCRTPLWKPSRTARSSRRSWCHWSNKRRP